jgi:tricorn protease
VEGRQIALFSTGRKHAGENLEQVLARRAGELEPPVQMCDALSRNTTGEFETIVANCMAHARPQFVDVAVNFPAECELLIETLGEVYGHDATQDAWDRFRLDEDAYNLLKETEKENKPEADSAKADTAKAGTVEPVELELDGAELRTGRLTIHSSSLGDALLSKDGETLYYLARFERGYNLWSTELRTRETKMVATLNAGRASMTWDKEQKSIFLLSNGSISKIDPSSGKRDNISFQAEMVQDRQALLDWMFEHVWNQTNETFYTAGFHGVDWEALKPVYEKYLPHIANGHEFAEMLSEMLGELNVSHSEG